MRDRQYLLKANGALPSTTKVNITKKANSEEYKVGIGVASAGFTNGSYPAGGNVSSTQKITSTGIKPGWYKSNNKYRYMKSTGGDAKSEWIKDNKRWYYMDSAGYRVLGWVKISGVWYYFKEEIENSYMVTGWNKIGSVWYYFKEEKNAAGEPLGYMVTGWRKIAKKWYYFKEEKNAAGEPLGYMVTGWKLINFKWYYFENQKDLSGKPLGYMITGWREIEYKWYYFEEEKNANGEPLGYWVDQICTDCELNKFKTGETYSEVYVSAKRPGEDKYGNQAPDLTYNDYSLDDLKDTDKITLEEFYNPANYAGVDWNQLVTETINNDTLLTCILSVKPDADALYTCDSDYFLKEFKNLVKFFSVGKKQELALDIVEHFRDGTGERFEDSRLTTYAREHENTIKYLENFEKALKNCISRNNGVIKNNKEDVAFNKELNSFKRPKFNLLRDIFTGLKIMVDDTIGIRIDVENYVYCHKCKRYSGTLKVHIYDHFGLDVTDYNDFYMQHNGFGAWFYLQHYEGFNGKYRPFITDMKFEKSL